MKPSVVIVDSGSANLRSIYRAVEKTGFRVQVSASSAVISRAAGIIFPGVGAFEQAMELLRQRGLAGSLKEAVLEGRPFLGICLGLQLLFSESEERGSREGQDAPQPGGLSILRGRVKRFPPGLPVPHVGWNRVFLKRPHPLFDGLPEGSYFYFTHSYYIQPLDEGVVLTVTEYGRPFASSVARGNLLGVQFHPEKSGPAGLRLLANFIRIVDSQAEVFSELREGE